MPVTKTEQLRVRLPRSVRNALEEYAKSQGQSATISSVIRDFIQIFLRPDAARVPILISNNASKALKDLAEAVGRTEEQTIDQCLLELQELAHGKSKEPPLIIKEARLRKSYKTGKTASSGRAAKSG